MNKCAGLKKTVDEDIGEDNCGYILINYAPITDETTGLTELPGGHAAE